MNRVIYAKTAVVGLLTMSMQGASKSLWTVVPPLPASCYTRGEKFDGDAERLQRELDDAIRRQADANNAFGLRLGELDPMAQQSRTIAFMRKDPVVAQRFLEDVANSGARQQVGIRVAEKRKTLDEKLKTLQAEYVADAAPLTPLFKRFQDARTSGPGSATFARAPGLAAAYDAAYDKFCPKWWGAASPFIGYLGERKRMLIELAIPYGDEDVRARKTQLEVMGIPATGYKSTAEMEAVKEYLIAARTIYQRRPDVPLRERQ